MVSILENNRGQQLNNGGQHLTQWGNQSTSFNRGIEK